MYVATVVVKATSPEEVVIVDTGELPVVVATGWLTSTTLVGTPPIVVGTVEVKAVLPENEVIV